MAITRRDLIHGERSPRGSWRPVQWLVVLVLAVGAAMVNAQAVAVVTNVKGAVTSTVASASGAVALLSELSQGADVTLQTGALLNLVYLQSGVEFQLSGPARVTIGASEPRSLSGKGPVARSSVVAAETVKLQTQNGRVVLGGIVMRGVRPERLKLLEPTGKVLDLRPEFAWLMPAGTTQVRVVLRDEGSDKVLVSVPVAGTRWKPDDSVVLQPGVNYLWSVEATLPGAGHLVRSSYFSLVSEPERQRMEALRPGPGAAFSDRLIFASLLEQARYVSESKKWWQQLSRERPDLLELRGLAKQ